MVGNHHGGSDIWIIKLSDTGSIQWQKCLGGSVYDLAYQIHPTPDGGYILAGETSSNDGDVSGHHGIGTYTYSDIWVAKLTSMADIQWQKCLGGQGWDGAASIITTTDGGYIVAGATDSKNGDVNGNHGYNDIWVVKLGTGTAAGISNPWENNANFTFSIFPNPNNGEFSFFTKRELQNAIVQITDISGRPVFVREFSFLEPDLPNCLDIRGLANGIYFMRLFNNEGSVTQKLVLRR